MAEMLFGQMPVLFVDGEQIAHSRAAFRYLAREFKLDGGNSLNAAKCDMWQEVEFEAISKLPFSEEDEAKKVWYHKLYSWKDKTFCTTQTISL